MGGYLGEDGPSCVGCGRNEVQCLQRGYECCGACTHTFDGGESRRYLCFGCNRVHWTASQSGTLPKRCPTCRNRHEQERNRVRMAARREEDVA